MKDAGKDGPAPHHPEDARADVALPDPAGLGGRREKTGPATLPDRSES